MLNEDYLIENGVLRSYSGNENKVIISAEITKIGKQAFKNNKTLTEIAFEGRSLKSIEDEAFFGCTSLKSITLPNGLIQIGNQAFRKCSKMAYAHIPSSVMLIGENAFESSVILLSTSDSEAEKYAKDNDLKFSTNVNDIVKAVNRKSIKPVTRSFDIFGETIICSNSLSLYDEVTSFYESRKDGLFRKLSADIPLDLKGRSSFLQNLSDIVNDECALTVKRLEKKGIAVSKTAPMEHALPVLQLLLKALQAIVELYKTTIEYREQSINDVTQAAFDEAESKVIGLDYGVIGSSLTLLTHEIDDIRERRRQRSAAYAEANEKIAKYKSEASTQLEKQYADTLTEHMPTLKMLTDRYLEFLKDFELTALIKEGLLDEDSFKKIDVDKSDAFMERILKSTNSDNRFMIAKALEQYPCNTDAFVYAKEHNYESEGMDNLIDFLGLKSKVSNILKSRSDAKHKAEVDTMERQLQNKTVDQGVELIKSQSDKFTQQEIKKFLNLMLPKAVNEIISILDYSGENDELVIKEWCDSKLDGIISDNSWNFYKENNVKIMGEKLPPDVTSDRNTLLNWLVSRIGSSLKQKEAKREESYQNACSALSNKNYDSAIMDFERLGDYKDSKNKLEEARKLKEKKIERILAIACSTVVLCIAVVLVITTAVKSYKYHNAVELMEAGKYNEAVTAFTELNGYKDSDEMVLKSKYDNATELIKTGKYDEAVTLFTELSGYKDSDDMVFEAKYTKAKELMRNGKYDDAVTAFTELNGYKDSVKLIADCKNYKDKGIYNEAVYLLKSGDTFKAIAKYVESGSQQKSQDIINAWRALYAQSVSVGSDHTVGLKSGGTVVVTGEDNRWGQCNVNGWTDIISVSAGDAYTVGLRSDGTVVSTGYNEFGQCNVNAWTDIVAVSTSVLGDHTVGLKSDGTVVATGRNEDGQCDVSEWSNIVAVSAGKFHTVGLKSDGTVLVVGSCANSEYEVRGWSDIVAVSAGAGYTVGLKSDGTVVIAGSTEQSKRYISEWKDIVAVSARDGHVVGLKSDGTVVAIGSNSFGECDISGWKDIISISAGATNTVGLKSDGTVVAAGYNYDDRCNVSGWLLKK